jgi:hypothetical protein
MAITISRTQVAYLVGLITCVVAAVLGQAELVGEPWHHYLSLVGIVGTAVNGYLLQPPRDSDAHTRAGDPPPSPKAGQ